MDIGIPGASGFFFLRDPVGDGNFSGFRSNRAAALSAVAEASARPLVELSVGESGMAVIWAATFPALPRMMSYDGTGINFSYDSWIWGERADTSSDITTFLMELEGEHEPFIPLSSGDGVSWCVSAYTSSDGGQNLYFLPPAGGQISDRIQKIRVWRAASLPEIPAEFWTQLVGTRQT